MPATFRRSFGASHHRLGAPYHPVALSETPPTAPLSLQPQQSLSTHSISLSNTELHYILIRRLRNDNLPDDAHTLLAERVTSFITIFSSFCTKLFILDRTPLVSLPTRRPRLALALRILAISQLQPLRILALPLIRLCRPLSWILAPFAAMSLPVAVHVLAKYIIRQFTPAPPPRPKFVDLVVETTAEVCEKVSKSVDRARQTVQNDLQSFFDAAPSRPPTLAEILPASFMDTAPDEAPPAQVVDVSSATTDVSCEEDSIQPNVPALWRRRAGRSSPLGLGALSGLGAGITTASDTRSESAKGA